MSNFVYTPGFVKDPENVFESLLKELEWERRDDAPRSEYYCNDFNEPYVYGRGRGERTYYPSPYHSEILKIRAALEDDLRCNLEVCFLNLYLNQRDHLGWHSDDSPEMDDKRPIVTVSLGVEREIWFRRLDSLKEITKVKLANGSACIMKAGTQKTHQHKIPKASFICGERISLTFRGYVPPV